MRVTGVLMDRIDNEPGDKRGIYRTKAFLLSQVQGTDRYGGGQEGESRSTEPRRNGLPTPGVWPLGNPISRPVNCLPHTTGRNTINEILLTFLYCGELI